MATDKRVFLKVKVKNLAAEAVIIRKEEAKRHGKDNSYERAALRNHRVQVVRKEQRHTLLAYGFLRGRRVDQIESPTTRSVIDWKKVKSMVNRYGTGFDTASFATWAGESM